MNDTKVPFEHRVKEWIEEKAELFADDCCETFEILVTLAFPILTAISLVSTILDEPWIWKTALAVYSIPWTIMFAIAVPGLVVSPYYRTFNYLWKHGVEIGPTRLIAILVEIGIIAIPVLFITLLCVE